jgi:hypothetical protein
MHDITAIFLTTNKMPAHWTAFHKQALLAAIGDRPLITLSREPMDYGINIIQDRQPSISNIYWQLLRGARVATTKYIAVVEDDTLYPEEHFLCRPKKHGIGYNMCKWSLFTWGEPMYSWRNRRGNYSMIGERELVIEALEERFAKYPDGTPEHLTGEIGRNMVERNLGITLRQADEFFTTIPLVNLNHNLATDILQANRRKRHGTMRAYDIPHWGPASQLVKEYR